MSKISEVERQISELQKEAEKLKTLEALQEIDRKAKAALETSKADDHAKASAAFVAFKKSEKYIQGLQEDLKATGTIATDQLTGTQATVKQLDDGNYRTFDQMTVGRTVEVSGRNFLIKSFAPSFGGSSAELLELNHTFTLAGKQATPYSAGTPCHIEGMKMTVSNQHKLKSDDVLVISGKHYIPRSIYQNSKAFAEYELELC